MLLGLSGRKQSGKDTVCLIIQYLIFMQKTNGNDWSFQEFLDTFDTVIHSSAPNYSEVSGWQRKLFADKLKDIVCLLIGCTREQLEDNTLKETPLGEEWDRMIDTSHVAEHRIITYSYFQTMGIMEQMYYAHQKLTPRLLLQLIGTDCGRKIIHPNIWVNALMSEYKPSFTYDLYSDNIDKEHWPNWIITDVRFPNEVKAIKDKGGLIFRIEREGLISTDLHESEVALDNYDQFDDVIYNRSDIPTLINTMEQVLKIHNIL